MPMRSTIGIPYSVISFGIVIFAPSTRSIMVGSTKTIGKDDDRTQQEEARSSSKVGKDDEKISSATGSNSIHGTTDNEDATHGKPASLSQLMSLAKPEMNMLILALFLMIISEATGLLNPLFVAQAYDDLVNPLLSPATRMSNINYTMFLVLMIHLGGVLLSFVRSAIMGVAGERIVARTRTNVYAAILKQEVAFFDRTKTGELVSRLGSDTAVLQVGTSQALPEIAVGIIKVAVSIAIMFWISPKLAGLMLGFVAIVMGLCVPFGGLLGKLSKTYQDVLGQAQTFSTEALGAVRTVQSFAAEDREEGRYRQVIGEPDVYTWWWPYDRISHRTTYSVGFFKSLTTVGLFTVIFGLGFAGMYFCLWYGFKLVNDGEITLGQLTAFQSYIFQIGGALAQTSQFISKLIEAQGAAARLFFLLERVPTIPTPVKQDAGVLGDDESPGPLKRPLSIYGAIDFTDVHFSYPSRPDIEVLRSFSLSIPANKTAALVGASGAGRFERGLCRIVFVHCSCLTHNQCHR